MAKGDVTMKFDAQTAQFVQAVMQARASLEATADTARKTGTEVTKVGDSLRKMGEDARKSFRDAETDADRLASKIQTVASAAASATSSLSTMAVAAAGAVASNQQTRIQQRADSFTNRTQALDSALAASGQGYTAGAIRQQLDGINMIGRRAVDPDEAVKLFANISRSMGSRVSSQQVLNATKVALLGEAGHMDTDAASQLGENYAYLEKERRPGGGFEGAAQTEIEDYAFALTTGRAGGISDRDRRFLSRAKDKRQAIGMLLAAGQSDESARGLTSIQTMAEEGVDPARILEIQGYDKQGKLRHRPNIVPGSEEERLLRVNQVIKSGGDLTAAVMADPTLAPPAERTAIQNLNRGAATASRISSFRGNVTATSGFEDFASMLERDRYESDVDKKNQLRRGEEASRKYENDKQRAETVFRREHPLASYLEINGYGVPAVISSVAATMMAHNDRVSSDAPGVGYIEDTLSHRLKGTPMHDQGVKAAQMQRTLEQIHSAIRQGTDVTKQGNQGGPGLSNPNIAGQQ